MKFLKELSQKFFLGNHKDKNLTLMTWQGASGLAFRSQRPQFVDLRVDWSAMSWLERWIIHKKLKLFRWQLSKVRNVKAILSIPVLKENRLGTWHSIGIINIDAPNEEIACYLDDNSEALGEYFTRFGIIIAKMF